MSKAEFRFRGEDGKALGTQGWDVDHENSSCTTYTGLWRSRKVVALLVAKGDFDSIGAELNDSGNFIVTACNSHATLLEYFNASTAWADTVGREDSTVEDEREAEARFDAATKAAHDAVAMVAP